MTANPPDKVISLLREALLDADGYLEADDGEERPDPGNIRRRLRKKIRAALSATAPKP